MKCIKKDLKMSKTINKSITMYLEKPLIPDAVLRIILVMLMAVQIKYRVVARCLTMFKDGC